MTTAPKPTADNAFGEPPAKVVKIKKNESKRDRFVRLAIARTQAAIKRIHLIGNLAGSGYESTTDQRTKIVKALVDAVEHTRHRLEKQGDDQQKFGF